jgi:Flp pilus assembly protein TadG
VFRNPDSTQDPKPRRDRGASAVEFALVLPLLLTLAFGIIEFGWAYGQHLDVRHGSREASRLVAVDYLPRTVDPATVSAGDHAAYIVDATCNRMDLSSDNEVTLSLAGGTGLVGEFAEVTVRSDLDTITGWFDALLGSKTLSSTVSTRLEQAATWSEVTSMTCAAAAAAIP